MKKLTLFLLTLIISCSVWGAKIYLNPGTNWKTDNARFAAYFFGNGDEKWVSMSQANYDNNVYCCEIPSGFSKVIFCRMNPSETANNWNNKWNQTGDLTIPTDGKNLFTNPNNAWNGAATSWDEYTEITIYTLDKDKEIYYTNDKEWENNTQFIIGRNAYNGDNYSTAYSMEKIEHTNLYYYKTTDKWENYNEWSVINTKDVWGGEYNSVTHRKDYSEDKNVGIGTSELNNCNLLSYDGKVTDLTSYTSLNHDQTINVTTDGSASTTGGSITASSYKLTASNTASKITVSGSTTETTLSAVYTATVTLNATANTDYQFVGWYEGDTQKSTNTTYTYTAENKPKTITAKFEIKKYTITVTAGEGGKVSGDSTYNHGTDATIEAIPNDGYEFVKWNDDNTDNPRTITNITSNQSYTATFSRKDRTFSDPSELDFGTYGKLTYQFSMPSDQWYWISLPFNVNIDQITTSTGNGAKDLVITYYDAKIRAENGKGGWMNAKEQKLTTLTANQGYVIGFYTDENTLFPANGVTINFPSASTTNTVADSANLATTEAIGKNEKDNNWHIIGTGLYRQGSLSNINYVAMPDNDGDYTYHYISTPIKDFEQLQSFAPFTAFFVQYGGEYSATAETTKSAALAPVARAKAQKQEQIYLINMNEAHTVVILNAEGSEGYTAGEDFLEMNIGSRIEMIYSFDGTDALAFNHRALEAQSIALGGYVATAGEQIISLNGYNANVESVTLIDNFTGETADLLAGDYTFTAEVGSLDGRFTVVFGAPKAGDTTVDCYNSTANQLIAYGSANACTVSGLTTGEAIAIYNTMGQLVFCTIAESETLTLPALTAGNYLILHNGTTNKTLLK